MKFEGEFQLPGDPDETIQRFTDVERMAACVPGAELEGRDEEGNWLGTLTVAFGPKRIRFRGKVSCEFDIPARTCLLVGRGAADMRAARFQVRTTVKVDEAAESAPDAPVSHVRLDSEADLSGVLAAFAGAGGARVGNILMDQFAENLAREYGQKEGSEQDKPASEAVSAGKVLWSAIRGGGGRD